MAEILAYMHLSLRHPLHPRRCDADFDVRGDIVAVEAVAVRDALAVDDHAVAPTAEPEDVSVIGFVVDVVTLVDIATAADSAAVANGDARTVRQHPCPPTSLCYRPHQHHVVSFPFRLWARLIQANHSWDSDLMMA